MMSDVITSRVIKPADCVLAFGIPTTSEAFFNALHNPHNRDFVPNCCPDWRDYYLQIVNYTESLLPKIARLGVTIVDSLTLNDYSTLFQQKWPVIILFSHWRDDSVEFADGMAGVSAIIDAVPPSYNGIIDLCVCHPKNLALGLRQSRPDCVIRFTDKTATPALWLYFYLEVFKKLNASRKTYLDAVEETVSEFIRKEQ